MFNKTMIQSGHGYVYSHQIQLYLTNEKCHLMLIKEWLVTNLATSYDA